MPSRMESDDAVPTDSRTPGSANAEREGTDSIRSGSESVGSAPTIRVKGPKWGKVPEPMLTDPDLEASDKVVLAYLCTFMNRDREAWPKLSTIAKAVGGSERTARRCVDRLRKAGWLRAEKGRRQSEYEIAADKGKFLSDLDRPLMASLVVPVDGLVGPRGADLDCPPAARIDKATDQRPTDQIQETSTATPPSLISSNGTAIVKANGRIPLDPGEANRFIVRFLGWFGRQYRRPHVHPMKADTMAVAEMLRGIRKSLAGHGELGTTDPIAVMAKAIDGAITDRHNVFPLNKGQDLTLKVLTGHWRTFFENVMKQAQDAGQFPPAHDVDLHQEQM